MKKYVLSFFLVFSLLFILCPIQNVSASDASTLELGDDIVATSSYRVKSKTKKSRYLRFMDNCCIEYYRRK